MTSFPGIQIGHPDRMVLAARDLLLEFGPLSAWCGGRIIRCEAFALPKEVTTPFVTVAAATMDSENPPGQVVRLRPRVQFGFAWESLREPLADDQASAVSMVSEVIRYMSTEDRQFLKVPRFGMRRLSDKVPDWEAVSFEAIRDTADGVVLGFAIQAEYRSTVRKGTWEPYSEGS